ncbi:MAG: hypothetical protein V1494_03810 [Candidatus Diapherotrites archaeon]
MLIKKAGVNFFTPESQINFLRKLFDKQPAKPRFTPGRDLAPEKIWMRKEYRGRLESAVLHKLYRGLKNPNATSQLVKGGHAKEYVEGWAQNKYGKTDKGTLEKSRKEAIIWFSRIHKRAEKMEAATRGIKKMALLHI